MPAKTFSNALMYILPWCILCLQVLRTTSQSMVSQYTLQPSAPFSARFTKSINTLICTLLTERDHMMTDLNHLTPIPTLKLLYVAYVNVKLVVVLFIVYLYSKRTNK